jgi:amidase
MNKKHRVLIAALTLTLAVVSAASPSFAQTAEAATKAAIARVRATDPKIHAVIALDPTALDQARTIDGRKGAHGLLYGYAILIKDNIESDGLLPTTAGSMALLANVTGPLH